MDNDELMIATLKPEHRWKSVYFNISFNAAGCKRAYSAPTEKYKDLSNPKNINN